MENNLDLIKKLVNIHKDIQSNPTSFIHELNKINNGNLLIIKKEDIINEIKKDINTIKEWQKWSENKRCLSSWYIIQTDNNKYEVGFINEHGNKENTKIFNDYSEAMGEFIISEIKNLIK